MIERIQKNYIIEDAIKKGIYSDNLLHVPGLIKDLLGNSDYKFRKWGTPLAPTYNATVEEVIDVSRIISFFNGLKRDHSVLDTALENVENLLTDLDWSFMLRKKMIDTKTNHLLKFAQNAQSANTANAAWVFSETFHNVENIDLNLSDVWVDTNQGICYIPDASNDSIIPPNQLEVIDYNLPKGCNFLDTTPQHAIDGSNLTSWKVFITQDVSPSFTVSFKETPITYISLDPLGFGIKVIIEVYSDQWSTVVTDNIYSKSTFTVGVKNVTKARITLSNTDSSFPKTIGLTSVTFFTSSSKKVASLYTKNLHPDIYFNELRITSNQDLPNGTELNCFYSLTSSGNWIPIEQNNWISIAQNNTNIVNDIGTYNFLLNPSIQSSNGLYSYRVASTSKTVSPNVGVMDVGVNQMEVKATRIDFTNLAEFPHNPSTTDFENTTVNTTWSSSKPILATSGSVLVQPYGVNLSSSINYTTPLIRSRAWDSLAYPYGDMTIIPLIGNNTLNPMQYGFVYSFKCKMYCLKQQLVNIGKYWFLQGYRTLASKTTYRQLGVSYGAFTLYVNGVKVAGDTRPYTIYDQLDSSKLGSPSYSTSNLEDGASNGIDFSFALNPGWNEFELLISLNDPLISFGKKSAYEVGDPYLQLSFYPNIFSSAFQSDFFITQLVGSGEINPVSQFDLLWNCPKDIRYWSWDPEDLGVIQFNSTSISKIDNFYEGEYPYHILTYPGNSTDTYKDIYLRFDFLRNDQGVTSPLLHDFGVYVR